MSRIDPDLSEIKQVASGKQYHKDKFYRQVRPKSSAGGGFRAKPIFQNPNKQESSKTNKRPPTVLSQSAQKYKSPQVSQFLRQSMPSAFSNNLAQDILNFDPQKTRKKDTIPKTSMDHQFIDYILGLGIAVNSNATD